MHARSAGLQRYMHGGGAAESMGAHACAGPGACVGRACHFEPSRVSLELHRVELVHAFFMGLGLLSRQVRFV
jgi:hypothetical protein